MYGRSMKLLLGSQKKGKNENAAVGRLRNTKHLRHRLPPVGLLAHPHGTEAYCDFLFFGGFILIPAVSLPIFSLLVGVTMIVDGGTNFFVVHRLAVQSSGAKICAAPSGRNVAAVSLGTSTTWTLTGAVMRSLCILESRHHQLIARRLCNHVTTAAMLHQLVTRLRFFLFFSKMFTVRRQRLRHLDEPVGQQPIASSVST